MGIEEDDPHARARALETRTEEIRCKLCDWPLYESIDQGCTAGSCSYRPDVGSAEWLRMKARRAELEATSAPDQAAPPNRWRAGQPTSAPEQAAPSQAPHPLDALRAYVANLRAGGLRMHACANAADGCLALATEAFAAVERERLLIVELGEALCARASEQLALDCDPRHADYDALDKTEGRLTEARAALDKHALEVVNGRG